jgi:smad nuclear-interacting protein 1
MRFQNHNRNRRIVASHPQCVPTTNGLITTMSERQKSDLKRIALSGGAKEDELAKQPRVASEQDAFEKANFALSGALARDKKTGNHSVTTQTGNTTVSKYAEPADACGPSGSWRIFVFKGDDCEETLFLHRKGYFIFGREENLADIVLNNPSCSKEHAALQYRKKPGGSPALYLIDLESTNGTFLNGERVVPAHYIEMKDGDVVTFGQSTKDYVFKNSKQKQ